MAAGQNSGKGFGVLTRAEALLTPKKMFLPFLAASLLVIAALSLFLGQAEDISPKETGLRTLNRSDSTGRSAYYLSGARFSGKPGETGIFDAGGAARPAVDYIVGKVERWSGVPGADVLVLANLEGQEVLSVLITGETAFWVEDLSISPEKDFSSYLKIFSPRFDPIPSIKTLVKRGDVVAVVYLADGLSEGLVSARALVLRRIGGLEQLRKETEMELTTPQ